MMQNVTKKHIIYGGTSPLSDNGTHIYLSSKNDKTNNDKSLIALYYIKLTEYRLVGPFTISTYLEYVVTEFG